MIFTNWAADMPESVSKTCAVVGRDVGQGYEWGDKSCRDSRRVHLSTRYDCSTNVERYLYFTDRLT